MLHLKSMSAAVLLASIGIGESEPAWSNDKLSELGKGLSKTHCARCHVVDSGDLFSGISSTPSFSLLVNGLEDWEDRFLSFHTRLPHQSVVRFKGDAVDPNESFSTVPMVLEHTDIDAIAAYAKTLKKN